MTKKDKVNQQMQDLNYSNMKTNQNLLMQDMNWTQRHEVVTFTYRQHQQSNTNNPGTYNQTQPLQKTNNQSRSHLILLFWQLANNSAEHPPPSML